jgi:hypothetical protein
MSLLMLINLLMLLIIVLLIFFLRTTYLHSVIGPLEINVFGNTYFTNTYIFIQKKALVDC